MAEYKVSSRVFSNEKKGTNDGAERLPGETQGDGDELSSVCMVPYRLPESLKRA